MPDEEGRKVAVHEIRTHDLCLENDERRTLVSMLPYDRALDPRPIGSASTIRVPPLGT
jgi:hypothetical protein